MAKIKLGRKHTRTVGTQKSKILIRQQDVEIIAETPYEKGLMARIYFHEASINIRDWKEDGEWKTALIIKYWKKTHCPTCAKRLDR